MSKSSIALTDFLGQAIYIQTDLVDGTHTIYKKAVITDPNDSTREAEFDNLFKIPVWIDVAHHEVHEGDAYSMHAFNNTPADNFELNTDQSVGIYFRTPVGTKRMHVVPEFQTGGVGFFEIRIDATRLAGGIAVTPTNRNHDSTKTSAATFFYKEDPTSGDMTMSDLGTRKGFDVLGQAGVKTASGGEGRALLELVLKPDTGYYFKLVSLEDNKTCDLKLHWYEHTDG